jgi:hypothetical protein
MASSASFKMNSGAVMLGYFIGNKIRCSYNKGREIQVKGAFLNLFQFEKQGTCFSN